MSISDQLNDSQSTDNTKLSTLVATLGGLAATATALNAIEVQEQEFIDPNTGDRFIVLGVDYQPGGQAAAGTGQGDPLSNADACLRDAALMQNLGVNAIRTYNVNPTLNHDECVSIFNSVGIYMLLDVNTPLEGQFIDRGDPQGTYTTGYLTHVFSVIEAFKDYDNLLGFFAANENINSVATAQNNPQYIRAVQRDMKNYIANHADRQIPVGYSAADVAEVLEDTWAYLQCQIDGDNNDMSRSDFFGLNSYSWCGADSSYTISGYNVLVEMFGKTTIPVFFSEYGCNDPQPRLFDEVPSLYGPKMTILSGGLVYEWTQEPSDFGLIKLNSDGGAKILPDYNTLLKKYDSLDVNLLTSQNNTATSLTPPACSADLISNDGFSTDFNIPDPPAGAQDLIDNGIPNAPSGKLVSVTSTSVEATVVQTDGSKVENLHIVTGATVANYPGAAVVTSSSSGDKGSSGDSGSSGNSGSSGDSDSSGDSGSSGANSLGNTVGTGALASVVAAVALGVVAFAL